MSGHGQRKHSRFSASGAERWLSCSASVALCETLPSVENEWSIEGTKAHEVLEAAMMARKYGDINFDYKKVDKAMAIHALRTTDFIYNKAAKLEDSEIQCETKVSLEFIHPDMFGTFDAAIIQHFGELHVVDFKYGKSLVSPVKNKQMMFYLVALAHYHDYNFEKYFTWIVQPRVWGYDGPLFWQIDLPTIKRYIDIFKAGVDRIESGKTSFVKGPHCHWCLGKNNGCPLFREQKLEKVKNIFKDIQIG